MNNKLLLPLPKCANCKAALPPPLRAAIHEPGPPQTGCANPQRRAEFKNLQMNTNTRLERPIAEWLE